MIRTRKIRINILVCFIILIGFTTVGIISYVTYSTIIRDDIKNISKLTATSIYSDFSSQLTKPIYVALTMANDSFVKDWLNNEQKIRTDSAYQMKITDYLKGLKEKYHYNSVFLVSEHTKNYYHFEGINKVVSPEDQHDTWYFNYVDSELTYALDIDTDEANFDTLSVFINCRIEDSNGKLLGVTGVGLELNQVQELLKQYKDDFHIEAMLFDKDGVVQIHSDSSLIEKSNVFDSLFIDADKFDILDNKDFAAVYEYRDQDSEGYVITKYIAELDWYLLVKKDTSIVMRSFQSTLEKNILVFIVSLLLIIIIIDQVIKSHDKSLRHIAKTDSLTGLTNRRGFDEAMNQILQSWNSKESCSVFVFDIDNFKKVNDNYGHLIGDEIICQIGALISDFLKTKGQVFRWGGDEFAGFIFGEKEQQKDIISDIFTIIRNKANIELYEATISMGITVLQEEDTIDSILKRADQALYQAKACGKNRYVIND